MDTEGTSRHSPITWAEIWRVAFKGTDKVARRRALRETSTLLGTSLAPALLGSFFAYVVATRAGETANYLGLVVAALLAGQFFLMFLSIAGTIFSKLWDSDGPQFSFSVALNLFHLAGVAITSGLIAIDPNMGTFSFFPVGLLSLVFFAVAIFHYYMMAIPSYFTNPDLQKSSSDRGAELATELAARMGHDRAQ